MVPLKMAIFPIYYKFAFKRYGKGQVAYKLTRIRCFGITGLTAIRSIIFVVMNTLLALSVIPAELAMHRAVEQEEQEIVSWRISWESC